MRESGNQIGKGHVYIKRPKARKYDGQNSRRVRERLCAEQKWWGVTQCGGRLEKNREAVSNTLKRYENECESELP